MTVQHVPTQEAPRLPPRCPFDQPHPRRYPPSKELVMATLFLHALLAQPGAPVHPDARALVLASVGSLLVALIMMRRIIQPLHDLLRVLASAVLAVALVVAALCLLIWSLLLYR